jgi:hypothetical protein
MKNINYYVGSRINIMRYYYNAVGYHQRKWIGTWRACELAKNNVLTTPPGVCFQDNDVYDPEPHIPGDIVQQRIDDAKPYEHRHRPYWQSLMVEDKRRNLSRQDA